MRLIKEEIGRMEEGYNEGPSDYEVYRGIENDPNKLNVAAMSDYVKGTNDRDLLFNAGPHLEQIATAVLQLKKGIDVAKNTELMKKSYDELDRLGLLDKAGVDPLNGPVVGESRRRRKVLPRGR